MTGSSVNSSPSAKTSTPQTLNAQDFAPWLDQPAEAAVKAGMSAAGLNAIDLFKLISPSGDPVKVGNTKRFAISVAGNIANKDVENGHSDTAATFILSTPYPLQTLKNLMPKLTDAQKQALSFNLEAISQNKTNQYTVKSRSFAADLVKYINNDRAALGIKKEKTSSHPSDAAVKPQYAIEFKQGNVGDCWTMSAINAVANNEKGRDLLHSIIKKGFNESGDFGYTVDLPGNDLKNPIFISKGDLVALAKAHRTVKGAREAQILELALRQYFDMNSDHKITDVAKVMKLLTGHAGKSSGKNPTDKETEDFLSTINKNPGVMATFGCGVNAKGKAVPRAADGTNGHEFTLIGVDAGKDENDPMGITYENPWNTYAQRHMSIAHFKKLMAAGDADFHYVLESRLPH